MAKSTGDVIKGDPLAKGSDDSKEGESVRNYASNPDAPQMKNGKAFKGAYGG